MVMTRTEDLMVRMEVTRVVITRAEAVAEAEAVGEVEATITIAAAEVVVIEGREEDREEVTSPLTTLGAVVDVTMDREVSPIMMTIFLAGMGIMLHFRLSEGMGVQGYHMASDFCNSIPTL